MKNNNLSLALCAAAFSFTILMHGAVAQPTAAQQNTLKNNCRSDFMSHCSGVTPGGADALNCLKTNVARLSPGCQSAVRAILPAAKAAPAAAPAAAPSQPAAAPPWATAPPHRPKAPLINAAVMLRACKLDLLRHCRNVQPGGGRPLACLTAHSSSLTIRCRTAMKVTSGLR
jgi:hypothetical protein